MHDRIAWIDVETDGLKAHEKSLLEVACLVTDTDLNILDDTGFEAVILYSPDRVDQMKANADPFVLDMHNTSGLWDKLPYGTPVSQVDLALFDYIRQFSPNKHQARLGGNSVRLDLNFVDEWLPQTYNHLHYRFIDVTTVATLGEWWVDAPIFHKVKAHTAMSDIRESIAELKYLREKMGLFRSTE